MTQDEDDDIAALTVMVDYVRKEMVRLDLTTAAELLAMARMELQRTIADGEVKRTICNA